MVIISETSTLNFGKFKGTVFQSTPEWYKNWLLNQKWFKISSDEAITHNTTQKRLSNWDGVSRGGEQAYYDMFELEKAEELKHDIEHGHVCAKCHKGSVFCHCPY